MSSDKSRCASAPSGPSLSRGNTPDATATMEDEMAMTSERYSLSAAEGLLVDEALAVLFEFRISAKSCWIELTNADDWVDK